MDKNTLSNYGWIVIAVLVLSVMIALATPFGSFIEQGVRSTTEGLFSTSQNAMNSAFGDLGVEVKDQIFEGGYTGGQSSATPSNPETPSEPEETPTTPTVPEKITPYETTLTEINTIDDLNELAQYVNEGYTFKDCTIMLMADIDCEMTLFESTIGSKTTPFKGTFDGVGRTIYNTDKPLFGHLENATVKNLTIDSGEIIKNDIAGILITSTSGAVIIENTSIKEHRIESNSCAGGLVGEITNGSVYIINVVVENTNIKAPTVGCIVGRSKNNELQILDTTIQNMFLESSEIPQNYFIGDGINYNNCQNATISYVRHIDAETGTITKIQVMAF